VGLVAGVDIGGTNIALGLVDDDHRVVESGRAKTPKKGPAAVVDRIAKAIADLGLWNYLIGLGAFMLGLAISAHPTTPLGRGRGVVVGMLACFLTGLLWICVFYVFSDDLSALPVFNDLGQWNLAVGIAFMAVGFTFATHWE
jgi:hypothetical protein